MAGRFDDDWSDVPARLPVLAQPPAWLPAPLAVPPTRWPTPRSVLPTFPNRTAGTATPGDVQGRCVEQLARLAYSIDAARHARLLSLRGLAEAAGVPLASVEGCLRGRGWPQFRTLGRMAAVLGLRLVVEPDQQRRLRVPLVSMARHRPGPDRAALERAAGDDQLALAAAWHNIAVGQLRWYVAAAGLTGKDVARLLRVRQATWSQARPEAPRRWVSLPVMSAVADLVGQRLVADARDRAWPWADWKGTQ